VAPHRAVRDTRRMATRLDLSFVTSADRVEALPPSDAEVAVVGRSNVGKSSLLNALAGRRELARTSKSPGRTQLLNCFSNADGGTIVDLPGYGYAKASSRDRAAWRRRMHTSLCEREPLVMTLLLVDGEVGPTRLDLEMLAWLRDHEVPFTVVATKHDKVKSSRRERRKRDLAAGCGLDPRAVVWVSAQRGVNIDRLRTQVVAWLTAPSGRSSAPTARDRAEG
jgi:GTP-binding protein